VVELPSDVEVMLTRQFDAPIQLVFDVLTKPEHMNQWFAPYGCTMTECSVDLRVGGSYHQVFATEDGGECSFRGTYLEVEPPTRTVETWVFEGRPHLEVVETMELSEADAVTTMTIRLAYRNQASRDEDIQNGYDGQQSSFDKMEDLLTSLVGPASPVAG
jgi:uncharacterized protein YndB with AHSA1/START domain